MAISLRRLRTQRGWTLAHMCEVLHISIATLSRIESAEFEQRRQPLDERVVWPLIESINQTFQSNYTLDDLSIVISTSKRGRPKKAKSEVKHGIPQM